MGIEFFLLLVVFILAVAGFMFFTGSFGLAKAGPKRDERGNRPTHAYVAPETRERTFGADSRDATRARAEG